MMPIAALKQIAGEIVLVQPLHEDVFAWPGGIPLTRALERLHPVSRPATYACAAVLCPLSVGAATIGGLFGPPGIWIYAGIVSLPAWLVLWRLRWRTRRLAALGGSEQDEAGLS